MTPALQRCRRNNIERRRETQKLLAMRGEAEVRAEAERARPARAIARARGRSARAAGGGGARPRAPPPPPPTRAPSRPPARPDAVPRAADDDEPEPGSDAARAARDAVAEFWRRGPAAAATAGHAARAGDAAAPRVVAADRRAAATLLRDWRGPLRTLVALDAAAPLGRARSLPRPHARSPPAAVGAERAAARQMMRRKLQTMRRCGGGANVGEVNPTYLSYVPSILELEPDARFVVLRRDKRETCESWYYWTEAGSERQVEGMGTMPVHLNAKNHWMRHDGSNYEFTGGRPHVSRRRGGARQARGDRALRRAVLLPGVSPRRAVAQQLSALPDGAALRLRSRRGNAPPPPLCILALSEPREPPLRSSNDDLFEFLGIDAEPFDGHICENKQRYLYLTRAGALASCPSRLRKAARPAPRAHARRARARADDDDTGGPRDLDQVNMG